MQNWILPEYIADVLPAEARKIEELRRIILDSFRSYGYELVMPPMLEYLESLLTVAGQDTDLYTFRLIDQLSGRTMGVRADMTTQVARIDAHLLNRTSVTRLCYVGSVLHARPSGLFVTREPLQIGAEMYGHSGVEADAEIHEMTRATLSLVGISSLTLDLGHVGILRALLADESELKKRESQVIRLLEIKDLTGIAELKPYCKKTSTLDALLALPNLYGNADVLKEARFVLPKLDGISRALDDLDSLADLSGRTSVTIDLADTRGYEYHSGVNFAAYVPGLPNALARGGRYDHIGEVFGRARPATGFSMDLRELAQILPSHASKKAIRAPWGRAPELLDKISSLRMQGEIVIQDMPGQTVEPDEFVCDSALVLDNGVWVVKPIN